MMYPESYMRPLCFIWFHFGLIQRAVILVALLLGPARVFASTSSTVNHNETKRGKIGEEAMSEFKQRHQAVLKLVEKNAKAQALQSEVDKLLDYEQLAYSALGGKKRYGENCADRCAEFNDLLAKLIRENYLRLIRQAKNGSIDYVGQKVSPRADAVKIRTQIVVKKPKKRRRKKIQVAYVMRKSNDRWLVVDIITEGVSLKNTYRFEFNRIRKRPGEEGGIGGIIGKIKTKLDELESKSD